MNDERLDLLLHRYLDGALNERELAELERRFLAEPQSRTRFWQTARLHAALREWGSRDWGRQLGAAEVIGTGVACPAPLPAALVQTQRRVRVLSLALAAALALAATLAFWPRPTAIAPALAPLELPANRAVAVLTRSVDAQWDNGALVAALAPGPLVLRSGKVQIDFAAGAQLVLEGPAQLTIVSEAEAVLSSGKAGVSVPPAAKRFRLRAGALTIAEAEGEYGARVEDGQFAEAHVFKGRARATRDDAEPRVLTGREALRAEPHGTHAFAAERGLFTTPEELAQTDLAARRVRFAAWQENSARWSADADALVHYTFEAQEPWETTLKNRAARTGATTDGSIVGARWGAGRWPGKHALEFRSAGDRIRLFVPGEHRAATVLLWVFAERLPHSCQSLLHSEAQRPGEVRWSLNSNGTLGVAIRSRASDDWEAFHRVVSSPRPSEQFVGRWMCLGLVYDSATGRLDHYIDGELLYPGRTPLRLPAVFEVCELANWGVDPMEVRWAWASQRGPEFYVRNLPGLIDEALILSRALSDEEMRRFSDEGRPIALPTLARK